MSVSAKQHESAKGIHISTLSWSSLLPPSMSHSSGLLQRPGMSSLSHMEMPIGYLFYIWLCKFPCYSFHTLHPLFPPHPPPAIHCVHNSVLHVCVSTAALQIIPSVPSCSVQSFSHVWLCNPMDCRMTGFPVHHQLSEFTQTHVHWVSDTIQPSNPLSFPSPPALSLSQHQGIFKWVSPSHQAAKVLEFQLQHQSFQWIFRTDFL